MSPGDADREEARLIRAVQKVQTGNVISLNSVMTLVDTKPLYLVEART